MAPESATVASSTSAGSDGSNSRNASSEHTSEHIMHEAENLDYQDRETVLPGKAMSSTSHGSLTSGKSTKGEVRNLILLGIIFMMYFGFRAGSLVVLPLCSKHLLADTVHGAEHSPLYSLPLAIWFLMDIILATPNAYMMQWFGRRPAFALGGFAASVASIAAFLVLQICSDPLTAFVLLNACVGVMAQSGMAEFVRFAAAEAVFSEKRRGLAVSRVIGFGALLSFVGPLSASLSSRVAAAAGDDLTAGYSFFFLCNAGFAFIYFVAACLLKLPVPSMLSGEEAPSPLCQILRRTSVWTAVLAQCTVQFAMVTPMTAMPLVMNHDLPGMHPESFRISGCIILHVTCMFAPGFWTGGLIEKLGEVAVLGAGLVVQALGLCVGLVSVTTVTCFASLALIGVGWNLAFVSGTMMLLASCSPSEKTKVTSANETLRFVACGVAVVLSSTLAWATLIYICLGALGCAALAIALRPRR